MWHLKEKKEIYKRCCLYTKKKWSVFTHYPQNDIMTHDIYQSKNCMTKNKQRQDVNADPMHLLISLFQFVKHIAAVSDSPYFFVYQRGQEVERFLFIEFYPRIQTLALSKQLHITPSPSTNRCFLR